MERELMNQLVQWKNDSNRKPLVLKGCRQTGKTWLMKEFGKRYFKHVAYINFDHNPRMQAVFQMDYDISRILLAINAETKVPIEPEDTLILFDEIQEAPDALSSLKYFCENARDYPVISAGSLLGVAIHKKVSFPVGKVNMMNLYPLSFREFLSAINEDALKEFLDQKDYASMQLFHDKYREHLKNYYYVGGMPEAVQRFLDTRDYLQVRQVQNEIIELYENDFGKHIEENELPRVRMVWNSIPLQLAKENKKFFFGQIKKGARSAEFEVAIQWLLDCGLIHKVYRVSKPAIPLKAYIEFAAYKLFLSDVGLLGAMSELDTSTLLEGNLIFTEFKGALTEQYVLQQLLSDTSYTPYYYTSESGKYELDFMIQKSGLVIPIEVKAEENIKSKSLRAYYDKYQPEEVYRLSMKEYQEQDWMINIPLWATGKI